MPTSPQRMAAYYDAAAAQLRRNRATGGWSSLSRSEGLRCAGMWPRTVLERLFGHLLGARAITPWREVRVRVFPPARVCFDRGALQPANRAR